MSDVSIIDASVVLAFLQRERGHERIGDIFDANPSWITTVNLCEVLGKLFERGVPVGDARTAIDNLRLSVIDFDVDLAQRAAALRLRTRKIGASLGDRACLALAERSKDEYSVTVHTAERAWKTIDWPFAIDLVRH